MLRSVSTSESSGFPCLWCGNVTGSRKSYCSDSCENHFKDWIDSEPAAIKGIRSPFWNIIRRRVFRRDGYLCQICGGTKNLFVHHIVPLSAGGDSTLRNLQVLCHACHQKEHGNKSESRRKTRIRIRYQPMYVPATFFSDWIYTVSIEVSL